MGDINIQPQQIQQSVPSVGGEMIGNLKSLKAGAGQPIKSNTEGFFIGDENFSTAPFRVDYTGKMTSGVAPGSQVIIDGNAGTVAFSYNGTQYAKILVDSSTHLIYDSDNHFFFSNNGITQFAEINTDGLILPSTHAIYFTGGSTLVDGGSYLAIKGAGGTGTMDLKTSGTVYPETDINKDLGANGKRYYTLWSKYLTTGDIVFQDRYCPICHKEFTEGDMLVNFVHKVDREIPDSPRFFTVPAHFECVKSYKKEKHAEISAFLKEKDDEHEHVQKRIEKEFDEKLIADNNQQSESH